METTQCFLGGGGGGEGLIEITHIYLFNLRANICKYLYLNTHFILNACGLTC